MFDNIISFIDRHKSFILTTHDTPDADGLGSQMVLAAILRISGKTVKIINSDPVPKNLNFLIITQEAETWNREKHLSFLENSAMLVLDTSEEYHIGIMRKHLKKTKEVFTIDHHEPALRKNIPGFIDSSAASTAELAVELACYMGIELDPQTATAAYAGIVYDTGFFAYPRTNLRTFRAASKTIEWGTDPNYIYKHMMEQSSYYAVLLQKQALTNLVFYVDKKLAVLKLSREDFKITGADFEDAENIVNIPLRAKEVEISLLFKEKESGEMRCSLRSKGRVNVSKIAQVFGGGGHVAAAGFKSSLRMEEIFKKLLPIIESRLVE
ncbi:MAG: bifunctional oligoribonuclease/PAP phosphatase NrnA [Treponema sp.]|nr:bifunctional oligoribonuclease/PAP phosphatase NrnA [Treponema sp.]